MFGRLKFESAKKILWVIMVTWHVKIGYSHLGGQENSVLKYSRTCLKRHCIFPLTPVSDQSRISPYYIYTKLSRQVVRMEKISNMGIRCQILQTYTMRIVWQTVRRIINEILGVKGLCSHLVLRLLLTFRGRKNRFLFYLTKLNSNIQRNVSIKKFMKSLKAPE